MKDSQGKPSAKLDDAFKKIPAPTSRAAEPVCKDLLAGGAKIIAELLACIGQTFGDAGGVKAKYTLHALAITSARPGAGADRKMVAEALAGHLAGDHSEDVKAFIVRQLQWCGRAEEVPALAVLLSHEVLCEPAAQALAAIGGAKAAAALSAALGTAKGKRRVTVITALGRLADASALPAIRAAAGDADRDVRLAALYALANAPDAEAADICLKAAAVQAPFERSQATDACLLLGRRLAQTGQGRESPKLLRRLLADRKGAGDVHDRCAILQTLAETSGKRAVADVMAAMDSKDTAYRTPAARTAVDLARAIKNDNRDDARKLLGKAIEATGDQATVQQAQALQAEMSP